MWCPSTSNNEFEFEFEFIIAIGTESAMYHVPSHNSGLLNRSFVACIQQQTLSATSYSDNDYNFYAVLTLHYLYRTFQ